MTVKNVCVIGAGLSGLCTIKELKEGGHNVVCYENKPYAGGVFGDGLQNNSYDSLSLTVSNYFMAYSALPVDTSESRRYWTVAEYGRYLQQYINAFGLDPHIKLQTEVVEVTRQTDSYSVTVKNAAGIQSTNVFDAVVVCTGTNRVPRMPKVPGADEFQGSIIHTEDYTNADKFKGKRVLSVGLGESGAEVAREIADVAESCLAISRTRPCIVPRWINGETGDAYTSKSFNALGQKGINHFMQIKSKLKLATKKNLSPVAKLHLEALADNPRFVNKFMTKNNEFMNNVCSGSLDIKYTSIRRFTKTGVILDDGSEFDVDAVVFNTGYSENFKFVESFIKLDNIRDLYKHMFHPDLGDSFALIGWSRPSQGGVPACSEMQARYLSLLLSGQRRLPQGAELRKKIEMDRHWEERYFSLSRNLTGLVDYHQYIRSLAKLVGCTPKVNPLTSPWLSCKLWFGSHLASTYRLNGPGELKEQSEQLILSLPIAASLGRNVSVTLITLLLSPVILLEKIKLRSMVKVS